MRGGALVYVIGMMIVTSVSAWIVGMRMRRRIKRALGKKVSETELTSISTWMEVDAAEERKQGGKIG